MLRCVFLLFVFIRVNSVIRVVRALADSVEDAEGVVVLAESRNCEAAPAGAKGGEQQTDAPSYPEEGKLVHSPCPEVEP